MDKYALVTGGSRGIGRAICLSLADSGNKILVNYKSNRDEAEKTLQMIRDNGGDGELLPFDVSNPQEIESVLNKWFDSNEDKKVEILINNAGIRNDDLMLLMSDEKWKSVIQTNLDSFFYVSRIVMKNMILNKYGRVVNIVSLSGIRGLPGQTNYSASKAGIIGATKALAQEVGRKKITVNAVAPGFIKTDMIKDLPEKELKSLIPMARFGEPEEVAKVVSFLASPDASYITGEVISVNGGLYT